MRTLEDHRQIIKEVIEEVYIDGIDTVTEFSFDEEENKIVGEFKDQSKIYDFEIDLNDGTLTY
ncbi:MAG: hypothetical protein HC934_02965 [Acaryochloridaceae cyanobacterium SU_2_1]|nr:hypothetical protein [Acaryochloridaceae cyanobacterium SU_2_1]